MTGRLIQLAWNATAVFFLASVISAPVIVAVRKAKARGKRLFATEPTARVKALHPTADHRQDIQ
jgi:hypothetical protein